MSSLRWKPYGKNSAAKAVSFGRWRLVVEPSILKKGQYTATIWFAGARVLLDTVDGGLEEAKLRVVEKMMEVAAEVAEVHSLLEADLLEADLAAMKRDNEREAG